MDSANWSWNLEWYEYMLFYHLQCIHGFTTLLIDMIWHDNEYFLRCKLQTPFNMLQLQCLCGLQAATGVTTNIPFLKVRKVLLIKRRSPSYVTFLEVGISNNLNVTEHAHWCIRFKRKKRTCVQGPCWSVPFSELLTTWFLRGRTIFWMVSGARSLSEYVRIYYFC